MKTNLEKINVNKIPSIFTIFGITGDLAAKKIIPSLWHLFIHNRLPKNVAIIGFSNTKLTDIKFKNLIFNILKNHSDSHIKETNFDTFLNLFSYNMGDFKDVEAYNSLLNKINEIEKDWGICTDKLFHLSVPPSLFQDIFKNLAIVKLNIPCGGELGWSRILIEKPFGIDKESSDKLQILLSKYFKEDQIYRIDHYLFKEIIQGIKNFRFSNNLFENIWNNETIDRIDIKLLEDIGVDRRGNFYDSIGALRDVGQNHFLSMLSAITTENSIDTDILKIRESRASIIASISKWTEENLNKNTFRGQYKSYRDIIGVDKDSKTETYFSIKTEINTPRWKDVPIYMEAGKNTGKVQKEIIITFKHPSNCYLCKIGDTLHESNRIIFRLEPNNEVVIYFWNKKPGFSEEVEERVFSFFLYEKETEDQYVEEYSKIIFSAMGGDQTLFISSSEVLNSWKFIDPIINHWNKDDVFLYEYEIGSLPSSNFNNNK